MFLFKKKQRLLQKKEYDHVFEEAKKIVTPDFIVLYRENNLGHARIGLALSKKKIPKSHDRNRIKRLLREGFRKRKLTSFDVIFLARNNLSVQTNLNINNKLKTTWEKLS